MSKTWVITVREYTAAVRTKSFIVSLILMPVMMFGSIIIQRATKGIVDTRDKKVAVIDRTGGKMLSALQVANTVRNSQIESGVKEGKPPESKFVFEGVTSSAEDEAAFEQLRFDLSQRVQKGDLFGFIEIGSKLYEIPPMQEMAKFAAATTQQGTPNPDTIGAAAEKGLGSERVIRYTTNRLTYAALSQFIQRTAAYEVYKNRLAAVGANVNELQLGQILTPPMINTKGTVFKDPTGKIREQSSGGQMAAFFRPMALLFLMFIVVLVGASPLTTNIIEEKNLRIAEVLLGSVRPFELMLGKLLGGVGVALTLAVIYLSTAWLGLKYGMEGIDVTQYITPALFAWFCLFTAVASLLYGSIFVAAGAAVTNVKEAQSLITPIMLIIILPMFFITQLLDDPNGKIPTILSFFPFSAPMMMLARMGVPPGPPAWQPFASAAAAIVATLFVVWCGGRVFRIGILLQGQAAKPLQMIKWIFGS